MSRRCPVPQCTEPMPEGEHACFCVEHHFQAPHAYTTLIFRTSIAAKRATDDETRKHLLEQRDAYVRSVIRVMGWGASKPEADHAA